MKAPTINGHLGVSLIKSAIRMAAAWALFHVAPLATVLFLAAELAGIVEEFS